MKCHPTMLALAAAAVLGCAAPAHASLETGRGLYRQNRIAEARAAYAAVLADASASAADKAGAGRELGRLAWLVDADAATAEGYLKAAIGTRAEVCETGELQVRVLREAGRTAQAAARGAALLPRCERPAEADDLRRQMMSAELDRAAQAPSGRAAALAAAARIWSQMGEDGHASLEANAAALQLAILRHDARGALAAWKGYFWLVDRNAPQAMADVEARTPAIFAAGLAPGAPAGDQLALLKLLIRAGFDETAHRFADANGLAVRAKGDPAWDRAVAYFGFVDAVRARTLAMNRTIARTGSKGDTKAYLSMVLGLAGALTHETSPAAVREALHREFGIYGKFGQVGGYPSMNAGHVVQDERRTVENYGRRAEIRFMAVDNMLSNGFESWLWDGSAMAGGWAEDGAVIVQVRPGYTSDPLAAYAALGDTPARRSTLAKLPAMEAADLQIAKAKAVAYLPSVGRRLDLQTVDAVGVKARAIAGPGGDLRNAFLREYWRIKLDQSIFLHEGRHVLDQAAKAEIGELASAELEYRAKLTELELGEIPKMSLATIDDQLIGGDTPHGVANTRIVKALSDWAGAHPGEVAGYDRTQPALLQIDKLSDAQIRAVARGLDPWAKAGG